MISVKKMAAMLLVITLFYSLVLIRLVRDFGVELKNLDSHRKDQVEYVKQQCQAMIQACNGGK